MFNWIGAGLVGAGGGAWVAGRMLAPGEESGDVTTLTPVSFETQEVARWLGYEAQKRQAVSKLTKEGTLSREAAKSAVEALIADRTLPTTYEKAATNLTTQWPELAERVRALGSEGRRTEAVRTLRAETGLGLLAAAQLVDVLAR